MIWFALAIIALIVELFTGTFYLLVLSLALAITGLIDWAAATSLSANLTICAIAALIGVVLVTRWHKRQKLLPISRDTQYDDLDLGQIVTVTGTDETGFLRVNYRGTQWQAKAQDHSALQVGDTAVITAREGNILLIQSNQE